MINEMQVMLLVAECEMRLSESNIILIIKYQIYFE